MTPIQGNAGEMHELARYEVRADALGEVTAAIHVEFIEYGQLDANAAFCRA